MVKSMTGFGKGEAALRNKKITVEIRSLNSKAVGPSLRLPAVYRQSEYEIRNPDRPHDPAGQGRRLRHGRVAGCRNVGAHQPRGVPRLRQMNDTRVLGIDAGYDAIVPVIMRLPDVVATEAEAISEEEHAALLAAVEAAAKLDVDAFREQEGAILIADLLRRVELIEQYKTEVVPFEKARTETVKARILDNLSKLAVDVDRNRLEQEMIFYLEKLDITEEKVRLANHCRYFREVASHRRRAQAASWASSHRRWAAKSTRWARRPTNRTSRYS